MTRRYRASTIVGGLYIKNAEVERLLRSQQAVGSIAAIYHIFRMLLVSRSHILNFHL